MLFLDALASLEEPFLKLTHSWFLRVLYLSCQSLTSDQHIWVHNMSCCFQLSPIGIAHLCPDFQTCCLDVHGYMILPGLWEEMDMWGCHNAWWDPPLQRCIPGPGKPHPPPGTRGCSSRRPAWCPRPGTTRLQTPVVDFRWHPELDPHTPSLSSLRFAPSQSGRPLPGRGINRELRKPPGSNRCRSPPRCSVSPSPPWRRRARWRSPGKTHLSQSSWGICSPIIVVRIIIWLNCSRIRSGESDLVCLLAVNLFRPPALPDGGSKVSSSSFSNVKPVRDSSQAVLHLHRVAAVLPQNTSNLNPPKLCFQNSSSLYDVMLRAPTTLDFVLPALRPCDRRRKPKSKYFKLTHNFNFQPNFVDRG